jgi:multidrug efflux system membrane fusion protein
LNKNVRAALIVLVLIAVWFLSGVLLEEPGDPIEQKANGVEQETVHEAVDVPALTRVKTRWLEAQSYSRQVIARGRTAVNRQVTLRAEVSGRVVAVPVEKGQAVSLGETVCELATEDRQQRVLEAESAVAEADIEYRGALKLKQRGFQSEVAIARAKARLDSAKADLSLKQMNLANTKIVAPFAGFIDTRPVEVGDYMDRNHICAELVEMNPLKVVAQLSEREVVRVTVGRSAEVTLSTGEKVRGEVIYLSHMADPVTRTYNMEIILPNPDYRLRAGVASQVLVAADELQAHRIPASLLALGDSGEVGVKVLDNKNSVRFRPVILVGDDSEGVWVTGLPPRVQLITVGQEYVSIGEQVTAEAETSEIQTTL